MVCVVFSVQYIEKSGYCEVGWTEILKFKVSGSLVVANYVNILICYGLFQTNTVINDMGIIL